MGDGRAEEAAVLRARREELGLTLEQVEQETRIPLAHLRAIEEGRFLDLPDGPWRDGFIRAYRRRLGLEEGHAQETPRPVKSPHRVPLPAVRALAVIAATSLVFAVLWRTVPRVIRWAREAPAETVEVADQEVKLTMAKRAPVRVRVDGEVVLDRIVEVNESLAFPGNDRIEVELSEAGAARIVYNGRSVTPQGRQNEPRRFVFVDDVEGR